jgi:transcriptional regulator with XRE-family HTH domain
MSIIGDRITERLARLEKSQTWLADRVGMTQQGIASIVAGDSERPRLLLEIATALETSQEYLLGETGDPAPVLNGQKQEVLRLFDGLPSEHRDTVLGLMRSLQKRE